MSDYMEQEFKIMPLLPLRGLSVFPGMLLTFDVERSASVAALDQAMKTDQLIFLAAQKDIATDVPRDKDIYHVGTVCRVRQQLRQPRSNVCRVMVEGLYRAEVASIDTEGKYYTALIHRLDDKPERISAARWESLVRNCLSRFGE